MTNEEINVAIAKECGWTVMQFGERNLYRPPEWDGGMAWERSKCPDYCNDLNAIHEAEKLLEGSARLDDLAYRRHMQDICGTLTKSIRSTARQRAEAFLKKLDLWKE